MTRHFPSLSAIRRKGDGAAPGQPIRFALACLLAITMQAEAGLLANALHQHWLKPRAADFVSASAALVPAIESLCLTNPARSGAALDQARSRWLASLSAWESLSGVAIGPVLERRSQRQIDFTPTRPRLIEKAIQSEPKSVAEMELIGTPAKGLPALEWLLWRRPVQPDTAACRYAVRVAQEIHAEAAAIAAAKEVALDDAQMRAELVNQWVGGIERLRWPGMEMPVRVARSSGKTTEPDYPRRSSGASAVAWVAQWRALRELALSGDGALVAQLKLAGKDTEAQALVEAVRVADQSMQGLTAADHDGILAAAKHLASLKHRVESEVAPALGVVIGFSDADGD